MPMAKKSQMGAEATIVGVLGGGFRWAGGCQLCKYTERSFDSVSRGACAMGCVWKRGHVWTYK